MIFMKFFLKIFFILTAFTARISIAQVDTTNQEKILFVAEERPSFPGGEAEMQKFLQSNLKYPATERELNIMGKCYITFVVEKNGSLKNIKILKGIPGGPGCDEEALRVVMLMPNWNPGKQNGKAVRVQTNLPIQFKLLSNDSINEKDTTYFYADFIRASKKEEATFYRLILKHENGYLVKDIYIKNGLPKKIAVCNSIDPLKMNGKYTSYYETGKKEEEGTYIRNEKNGVWMNWFENGQKKSRGNFVNDKYDGTWIERDENGTDSSLMECFPDATYKNIRLSANQVTVNDQYNVFYPVGVRAEFPGGDKAMQEFIQEHVVYPRAERDAGISGTCYVTFVVEKNGALSDIRILRGIPNAAGYNKEVLRLVNSMPTWSPGMQFGKPIRVQFNMPVRFTLR
jgi:TonB family protein